MSIGDSAVDISQTHYIIEETINKIGYKAAYVQRKKEKGEIISSAKCGKSIESMYLLP